MTLRSLVLAMPKRYTEVPERKALFIHRQRFFIHMKVQGQNNFHNIISIFVTISFY